MIRITIETYPDGPGRRPATSQTIELELDAGLPHRSYRVRSEPGQYRATIRVRDSIPLIDAVLTALRALKARERKTP